MAQLTLSLPRTISKHDKVVMHADNAQQLFEQIKLIDTNAFDCLFHQDSACIKPKAFVSFFINEDLVFDYGYLFNEGDRIVLGIAIAGG